MYGPKDIEKSIYPWMITQLMIGIQKFVKGLSFILIQMQTGFSMDQKLIDQQW